MAVSKGNNWWKYALLGGAAFAAGRGTADDNSVAADDPGDWETVDVYYANCTEAREAGAAPVSADDPGYAPHLDRDSDGVGCE